MKQFTKGQDVLVFLGGLWEHAIYLRADNDGQSHHVICNEGNARGQWKCDISEIRAPDDFEPEEIGVPDDTNKEPIKVCCATCDYGYLRKTEIGDVIECRINPPTCLSDSDNSDPYCHSPLMFPTDWCAQHPHFAAGVVDNGRKEQDSTS